MKTRYETAHLIISVIAVTAVCAFIGTLVYVTELAKAGMI